MLLRRVVIAMGCAIALFLFYRWDVDRVETRELSRFQEDRVLFVNPMQAVALTFESTTDTLRLERSGPGDEWQIVEPVQRRADDVNVNAYLENLRGAKRQATFPASDLATYGLDEPRLAVTVTINEGTGERSETLLLGKQPRDLANVYAMVRGRDQIFTVSEWLYRQSRKSVADVVDRTVVPDSIARAQEIRVEGQYGTMTLKREDQTSNRWTLRLPAGREIPADGQIVSRLDTNLDTLRFVNTFDNPTSTPAQMRLSPPLARLYVDDREVLQLGDHLRGREQFIARSADGTIGAVPVVLVADLFRDPLEWGSKRFVWMPRDEIRRIAIGNADSETALIRDGNRWRLEDGEEVALRQDRIAQLVDDLLAFGARQLVRPELPAEEELRYGLLDGSYTVNVETEKGRAEGFRLGRTDTRNGVTYVQRLQDRSLWQIDFTQQRTIFTTRAELLEQRLLPNLAERTNGFDLITEAGTVVFRRTGATWNASFPDRGGSQIPASIVMPFLDAFENMEIRSEILGRRAPKLAAEFVLYSEGSDTPFARVGVVSRTQTSAMLFMDDRLIEVSAEQFERFDNAMVRLGLLARAEVEKQVPRSAP